MSLYSWADKNEEEMFDSDHKTVRRDSIQEPFDLPSVDI
jgi:hypothetical protein